MVEYSQGLEGLPPYLFAKMESRISELRKKGVDIISLGIGDPDLPTPGFIIDAISDALKDPKNHQYPTSQGEIETRQAVSRWYKRRFKVDLDPETEISITIGSKEGLANISRAFLNPGDKVLVPDPAYPVYRQAATILTNGIPISLPLTEENGFLPDLEFIKNQGRKAKMMFMNYPNNPTAAIADRRSLKALAQTANDLGIILVYDNAYSEFSFDDYKAPSILEFTDNAIEFHSVSKTFNMTGHRIGMAVGHADLINGLRRVKSQLDSGAPKYIQHGAVVALDSYPRSGTKPEFVTRNMSVYQKRRDALIKGLAKCGLKCQVPKATFYVWVGVPGSGADFCDILLNMGVVATPGTGFGEHGEGYIRFALTQPEARIKEAVQRMTASKEIAKIITKGGK